jgi:hypothetical protein
VVPRSPKYDKVASKQNSPERLATAKLLDAARNFSKKK